MLKNFLSAPNLLSNNDQCTKKYSSTTKMIMAIRNSEGERERGRERFV